MQLGTLLTRFTTSFNRFMLIQLFLVTLCVVYIDILYLLVCGIGIIIY